MNPIQSAYAPAGKPRQAVYTPKCIRDLLLEIWPEGLACDPFPGVGAPVSEMADSVLEDGFTEAWPHRSYANPPFWDLKKAMQHAAKQTGERILLGPAMTSREWFWSCGGQVKGWLKPIAFENETSTFPKPLVLHWYGPVERKYEVARIMRNFGQSAPGRVRPLCRFVGLE